MSNLKESEIKKSGLSEEDIKPYNLSPSCLVNYYPGCGAGGCLEWYLSPIGGSSSCLTYELGFGPGGGGGGGGDGGEEESCRPLATSSSMPIRRARDQQKHTSGEHWGSVIFTTHCDRTRECRQQCQVTTETGIGDEGQLATSYYHSGYIQGMGDSADGPRGQNITCKGIAAVAFKDCLVPNCNLNLTINFGHDGNGVVINVENEFWKHPFEHVGICNMP